MQAQGERVRAARETRLTPPTVESSQACEGEGGIVAADLTALRHAEKLAGGARHGLTAQDTPIAGDPVGPYTCGVDAGACSVLAHERERGIYEREGKRL